MLSARVWRSLLLVVPRLLCYHAQDHRGHRFLFPVVCLQLRTQDSCPGTWRRWNVLLEWLQSVFLGNCTFPLLCSSSVYQSCLNICALDLHFHKFSCSSNTSLEEALMCCLYSIPFSLLLIALHNKLIFPPSLYSNRSAIGGSWVPSHCPTKLVLFSLLM